MDAESIVERLRKVSMAKAKESWATSGKQVRKGGLAQDMREDLEDYLAAREDDQDDPTMPAADDPGWHDVGGAADDGGSDDDGRSDADATEEDDYQEKEPEKELYRPRSLGGKGLTISKEQEKLAKEHIEEAAKFQAEKEASRDKAYEKAREQFESVRDTINVLPGCGEKHDLSDRQIKEIIERTATGDVDFGYGENGPSGGLHFQLTAGPKRGGGLRTIVGRIRDNELYVFHAGETGGSKFTRLKY